MHSGTWDACRKAGEKLRGANKWSFIHGSPAELHCCGSREVMAHCVREFTVPLCCGGWSSRGTNRYVSTVTSIFIVPAVEVAKHALPNTGGLTVSELFSVAESGDFIPARMYGFQYKLQTRRSKNSSGNYCTDLVLGFSKMSAWADCLRLSEVLGICVSNLIMHPRKS